jgi:benzylsuccinate CoA-transferase BbsF subunit
MSCTDAGLVLTGPELMKTVNRSIRRDYHALNSNRSPSPAMAPHGVYAAAGQDRWVAIACRDDRDWNEIADVIGETWCREDRFAGLAGRLAAEDELDDLISQWSAGNDRDDSVAALRARSVTASIVATPEDRIEHDAATADWGLWPTVTHAEIGRVRVDGIPVHMSETDWVIERGAPCLGEHNREVFGDILGVSEDELCRLQAAGVI